MSSFEVRDATPFDVGAVVPLIMAAYGDYAYYIAGTRSLETLKERLAFFFTHRKINLVHYSHSLVLCEKETGHVVGFTSFLRGDFMPFYFGMLGELLGLLWEQNKKEETLLESIRGCVGPLFAKRDEMHLDILAISPEYQNRGGAKLLLEQVFKEAREHRLFKVSLLALESLKSLYDKWGFTPEEDLVFDRNKHYIRFVKDVRGVKNLL